MAQDSPISVAPTMEAIGHGGCTETDGVDEVWDIVSQAQHGETPQPTYKYFRNMIATH